MFHPSPPTPLPQGARGDAFVRRISRSIRVVTIRGTAEAAPAPVTLAVDVVSFVKFGHLQDEDGKYRL